MCHCYCVIGLDHLGSRPAAKPFPSREACEWVTEEEQGFDRPSRTMAWEEEAGGRSQGHNPLLEWLYRH